MATKTATPNLPRFQDIKNRVADIYAHQGDAIRAKATVWSTAKIFEELTWLIAEIKRLAGGAKAVADPDRFRRISGFVKRVSEENAAAITGGQIIKISAEIFGAMRFLVRALEAILVNIVDEEIASEMTADRLPDEHSERINLDLTAGVADPDDDDDADDSDVTDTEKAPVSRVVPPRTLERSSAAIGGTSDDADLPG